MLGAWGVGRSSSWLGVWKRRLLGAVALGALPLPGGLTSPGPAWGQISETLPEVTVSAPRPKPRPPRRTEPAPRRAASSAPATREPAPAAPEPAPAVTAPSPFQFVAPTPITGLGIDRSKVPAMVQTLPAEDFSRTYSPNVVETFVQRIPGVTTNNVQGNEFATDLRYRGFAASPLQGTPQGLAVYMQGIRINEAFGDTVNLGLDSEGRDRPLGYLDQQSGLRPQRPWWRDQLPDEGRLHLQRHRIRYLRRLLRPRRRVPAIRRAQRGVGPLSCRGRPQGRRLALPVAIAAGALLWRSRLEGHRCRNSSGHVRSRQLLRRDRAHADRTARQRLSRDLHLAADHQKPGGTDCAQRPLLRDRPLDGAEQSLLSPVRPAACRRQRRRGRALQRGRQQSAVQHTVPRKRSLPAAATAGGCLPDPQSEWPTDQLSAWWWQYLRDHALGHRRPHLHQGADDRRLVAGPQRRQGARSRQQLRDRRQRRPQQDRVPGQQRAWLYLSRSLRRSQRRCARDGRDCSHRGQSRL